MNDPLPAVPGTQNGVDAASDEASTCDGASAMTSAPLPSKSCSEVSSPASLKAPEAATPPVLAPEKPPLAPLAPLEGDGLPAPAAAAPLVLDTPL
jgi:hypothetical protein